MREVPKCQRHFGLLSVLPVSRVWFSLRVPMAGILQGLSSKKLPYRSHSSISKGVTFSTPCHERECMRALYHKIVEMVGSFHPLKIGVSTENA